VNGVGEVTGERVGMTYSVGNADGGGAGASALHEMSASVSSGAAVRTDAVSAAPSASNGRCASTLSRRQPPIDHDVARVRNDHRDLAPYRGHFMSRPSRSVLLAFLAVVLIGGSNFVAVRFSNRELPPFFGAGLRFAIAAVLLFILARVRRITLPHGAALPGVIVFGLVNFGVSYAFAYWGLMSAPSALAATLVALVPLLTFFMTIALGMERFRWAGLVGGLVAVAGVAVVFADQLDATVPPLAIAALLANVVGVAVSTVLLKRLPNTDPIATNAVALVPGALLLLLLAAISGERWAAPTRPEVWAAFLYLATIGTLALFIGVVYVVQRWTASASSYVTVLFPVVTVSLGAILAGELVSLQFVVGAAMVMAGTYVGAIAR